MKQLSTPFTLALFLFIVCSGYGQREKDPAILLNYGLNINYYTKF